MNALVRGLVTGCLATLPMTVAMAAMKRRLPWWERYALPQRQITRTFVRKVGATPWLEPLNTTELTTAAHFGYGSAAGAPYTILIEPLSAPAPVKGAAYGLFVWAASYLVILPGLNILYPATRHPRRRNLLMIVAHLVWGVSLAMLSQALTRSGDIKPLDRRKIPPVQGAGEQTGPALLGRRDRGR